jgi:hypothetical protein
LSFNALFIFQFLCEILGAMNPVFHCSALIFILAIDALASSEREDKLALATFISEKISLAYPTKYYQDAKIHTLPKKIYGGGAGPPFGAGPARYAIEFSSHRQQARHAGRYYYPSYSVIYVTPLHDPTVPDFDKAYPGLSGTVRLLRELLKDAPNDLYLWTAQRSSPSRGWILPDEPFSNAGACLLARFLIISASWGDGCRFLTYYRNGKAGYGATNQELVYNFQGTLKHNDFYVSARLAVRHDRLPDSIDDPRAASEETEEEQRAEHDRINRWPNKSFYPPLTQLDSMIESLRIKQ